jgi:UDPglucose 6-dehydrogenase
MKRISVVGLGFVGLSTAVFFADKGYQVFLSSNDKAKVSLTREGKTPFFEPELERARAQPTRSLELSTSREFIRFAESRLHWWTLQTLLCQKRRRKLVFPT